jgi:hypothetical protein
MLIKALGFEWQKDGEEGYIRSSYFAGLYMGQHRTGAASFRLQSYSGDFGGTFNLPFGVGLSEFYYQFAYMYNTSPGSTTKILALRSGTTNIAGLKFTTTGILELWTGNFVIKVADSNPTVLLPNTWYVIEIYYVLADSNGVFTLRVDMNPVATFTGDTKPGTETAIDNALHGGFVNGGDIYLDDIIINDTTGTRNNSWPNGARIVLLLPTGDGSPIDWTPTPSGNHYSAVDEIPPSGADYLQATVVDKIETLSLADLPVEAASVRAVVLQAWAFKNSILAPTRLALGMKLGANSYFSSDMGLLASEGLAKQVWETNPAGGVFMPADVNGAQLLLKSRT